MNVKKIVSDCLSTCFVVILLIYIFVSNVRITYGMYMMSELSINLIYFGVVGIILYIINKILNKIKFDIYDIFILGLIFFGIISTIYAIDVDVSLYGFEGRFEGLFQLILYYILFLNCKNMYNKKFKIVLVGLIIGVAVLQSLYGIMQFLDVEMMFGFEILRNRFYSNAFEINPNFFGTLTIIGLSLSLTLYFIKKGTFMTLITLIISTVLFFGLLCSGAMSVAIALFVLFVALIVLFFVLKLDKWQMLIKCLMVIIAFLVSYRVFNFHDKGYYFSQIGKTTYEMGEVLKGDSEPIYGSGRIHIWKKTLAIVPDNLWNGVGIDNFYYAFDNGTGRVLIDVKSKLAVDKAHNEYLQKLITEGIFSFLIYLIMLIIIFVEAIKKLLVKKKDDYLLLALFLCFVVYCVQAFFNISVISVAPMFYIIMGLLCSLIKGDRNEEVKN